MLTLRPLRTLFDAGGGEKGIITKTQFRTEALALGVDAPHADLNVLFQELDLDGGGSLDSYEMKEALKAMVEECGQVKSSIKELKVSVSEKEKAAKAAQAVWKKLKEDEEMAEKDAQDRAARDAELSAQAVANAKRARAAKEAEKQAAAAAEKAAFDARIALKRGSAKP